MDAIEIKVTVDVDEWSESKRLALHDAVEDPSLYSLTHVKSGWAVTRCSDRETLAELMAEIDDLSLWELDDPRESKEAEIVRSAIARKGQELAEKRSKTC